MTEIYKALKETDESFAKTMIDSFQQYAACFHGDGNKVGGYLIECRTNEPGEIKGMDVMKKPFKHKLGHEGGKDAV